MIPLRPVVLFFFFFLAGTLAAQVPIAPVELDVAFGLQDEPKLASDGDRYFMVWSDSRSGDTVPFGGTLFGSVVDENGALLTPEGVVVASGQFKDAFYVLSTATHYLVVWTSPGSGTFVRRFDRDGHAFDRTPIHLSNDHAETMASNGTTVAIWFFRGPIAFYDEQLRLIRNVPIASLGLKDEHYILGTDGTGYLVAGTPVEAPPAGRRRIAAGRLDATGNVVRRPEVAIETDKAFFGAQVAWNGFQYVVAYGTGGIEGRCLDRDGKPSGAPFHVHGSVSSLAIAGGGGTALIVYGEYVGDISAVPVLDCAAASPRSIAATTRRESMPAIATNGRGGWVAAWAHRDEANVRSGGIDTAPIRHDAIRLDATRIQQPTTEKGLSAREQRNVATNGTLEVWEEERGAVLADQTARPSQIRARIGERVFTVWPSTEQHSPVTATDGNTHLVVWLEGSYPGLAAVRGIRLDHNGAALDREPIRIGNVRIVWTPLDFLEAPLSVIWTGRQYLVAFSGDTMRVARVSSSGVVLDPGGVDLATPLRQPQWAPVLTGGGDTFFIAWQEGEYRRCIPECPDRAAIVRASRIDDEGRTIGPPIEVALHCIGCPTRAGLRPSAAWNGASLAITWYDANADVLFQRFDQHGATLHAPLFLGRTRGSQSVLNDRESVVAWDDEAGGISYSVIGAGQTRTTLRLAGEGHRPVLRRDASGNLVVLWESAATSAAPRVHRIVQHTVAPASRRRIVTP
jgi:hypothetical protein